MFRNKVVRTAVHLLAATAVTLTIAAAAPASAASGSELSPRALADQLASRLPAPNVGATAAPASENVLPLSGSKGGPSTNEVIVCTGSAELRLGTAVINYARAQARTTCPVYMDWIVAQAYLYEFDALNGAWILVTIGTPDAGPGVQRQSATPDYFCADASHDYVAISYHSVRRGNATAVNVFSSAIRSCSARLPF
jgi:hypothetical protein